MFKRLRRATRLRSRKAESMIETLIALTVIVLATSASVGMLRTSVIGNEVIGTKAVALNLALEGIEAVKNVRDTNYLRFASDPENCWNKLNISEVSECQAIGAESIQNTNSGSIYTFQRDFGGNPFKWDLVFVDADNTGDLDLYEVDLTGDASPDLEYYARSGLTGSGFNALESNVYNRILEVEYAPDGLSYDATVTVSWVVNNAQKALSLTRTIANVY